MPKIVVKESESLEDALRRFKRDVSRSGTLQEARKESTMLNQVLIENWSAKHQEAKDNFRTLKGPFSC